VEVKNGSLFAIHYKKVVPVEDFRFIVGMLDRLACALRQSQHHSC
jgi:hypothetical protein